MSKSNSKLYSTLFGSTFGHIAFASFLIAVFSGVLLAVFYDVGKPFDSLSLLLITNPSAVLIRSIHYWSAQLFLIFIILHIWDHLRKSTEVKVKSGIWIRLAICIVVVFLVMLTGFILKADTDSLQARRILESLINDIPLLGNYISYFLLGKEDDFQLIYVHHIATTTIFIWIVIVEHVKLIWPNARTLLYFLLPILLLSIFYPAGLISNQEIVMKGPWYFLGVQELFHYMSSPSIILCIFLVLLSLIIYLQKFNEINRKRIKTFWFLVSLLYLALVLLGFFFRGENWDFVLPWNNEYFSNSKINPITNSSNYFTEYNTQKRIDNILGEREGCQYCHTEMKGFSPSHDPKAIGCASCHLGNKFTLNKSLAHSGILKIPGNLETADRSCGQSSCHPGIKERVENSIMNTMSGVVSVDKYVFGELKNLNELHRIRDIEFSPAETHLRNLCASCHIGNEKAEYGPISENSRGGGCNACHLNYSNNAINDLQKLRNSLNDSSIVNFHPSLDLNIKNDHCFGCHSRSGRISTNYEGWHETQLVENEMPSDSLYRLLEDGRVFRFVKADVHHERGLNCIDCHNSFELMGDGNLYPHQEDQSIIQCEDCHFSEFPKYVNFDELDNESKKITELRGFDSEGRKYLVTEKKNIPLINTFIDSIEKPKMLGKNSKKVFSLNAPKLVCSEGKAHDRLTCNSCHSSWSPQCVGCHTEFDRSEKGTDHLTKKETRGSWIEYAGKFIADRTTLGIRLNDRGEEVVETFIPGMVMTLNKSKFNSSDTLESFHRLFSPTISHTTSAEGRTCISCHIDPVAIGYGRGELIFEPTGYWKFQNEYSLNSNDSLPEDAWIGFLTEKQGSSTRVGTRPFTIAEQRKILNVGACLTCHDERSNIMRESLINFESLLKKTSNNCIIPKWNN